MLLLDGVIKMLLITCYKMEQMSSYQYILLAFKDTINSLLLKIRDWLVNIYSFDF